jgi:tetratricopeptide (TPR) repeat protein
VKLDPTCLPAWQALVSVRKSRGQRTEALAALRSAVQALPREDSLRSRLAWELATSPASSKPEADEALALARTGIEGRAQDPAALNVLAVALARTGQYAEAAETCKLALDIARAQGSARLVQLLEGQLALFEAGKPYLE